ncbi:hypothetical protein ACFX2C_024647 [Malus domestica]
MEHRGGRRARRGRRTRRKEDAENTERMHRCRTSAIRHTALRLSRAGNPRRACRSGPFSSSVPRATSNAGSPSPGRWALFPCLSPEQPTTLKLL